MTSSELLVHLGMVRGLERLVIKERWINNLEEMMLQQENEGSNRPPPHERYVLHLGSFLCGQFAESLSFLCLVGKYVPETKHAPQNNGLVDFGCADGRLRTFLDLGPNIGSLRKLKHIKSLHITLTYLMGPHFTCDEEVNLEVIPHPQKLPRDLKIPGVDMDKVQLHSRAWYLPQRLPPGIQQLVLFNSTRKIPWSQKARSDAMNLVKEREQIIIDSVVEEVASQNDPWFPDLPDVRYEKREDELTEKKPTELNWIRVFKGSNDDLHQLSREYQY